MTDNPHTMRWDERYGADDYVFGKEPNDFLNAEAHRLNTSSEVLCLADGEGRNGVFLAAHGHQVTSIDQSAVGLEKANQLAKERSVRLKTIQADLTQYDIGEEQWDAIVSIFFHLPPGPRKIIYPRIIRALKPGGLLILESYTPKQLEFKTGGPPVAENMLTEEIISDEFEELEFLHLEELERDVVEGKGHTGHAAVLQLVARK
jgi:SAM-dependent methyltransferase